MKPKIIFLLITTVFITTIVNAQSQLIKNLAAGKHQVLVAYGTSLTAGDGGREWVNSVSNTLNKKYNNNLITFNAAKSSMWSWWGLENLKDSVISRKPDAVIIEFAMNDAFVDYNTSLRQAKRNLNYMINRIKIYNPKCEVILQTMNIPINVHADKRPDILAYYQVYREIAAERKLLLIDHYPHWRKILDKGKDVYLKYVPDGIHPDAKSAKAIIAPYVLQRLLEGK
jgi:acyl-CoA thioesterase-1